MNGEEFLKLLISPTNILISFLALLIIVVYTMFSANSIDNLEDRRDYKRNIYHKLFCSGIFAVYYIGIFKGGDTYAYFCTMEVLQNLMFDDFGKYLTIVNDPPSMEYYFGYFNYNIGYPPRFIYMEEESFSVAKFLLPFYVITFNSYLALTFLLAFIMSKANWKIYMIAKSTGIFQKTLLKIFVLYLPSVAFWCSGVSKDMLVYTSILFCVYYLYSLLRLKPTLFKKMQYVLGLIVFSYIIYRTRPFILYPLLVPILLMAVTGVINRIKSFSFLRIIIKGVVYTSLVIGILIGLALVTANNLLESSESFSEAVIVQQDFKNNKGVYGADDSKRYDLGITDYSPLGIMKVAPLTVLTGIYRPFLWEGLTPSLIFNGLESVFYLFMTFWFIFVKFKVRLNAFQTNELLSFAIGFVFVFAFIAGFTSILFGVLVRIRAPLLPFLGMLLSIDYKSYLKSLVPSTNL